VCEVKVATAAINQFAGGANEGRVANVGEVSGEMCVASLQKAEVESMAE